MLVEMDDLRGWTVGAPGEDAKLADPHFSDIDPLTIVADSRWEKSMALSCKPFTRAELG